MILFIHRLTALISFLCIAIFFITTASVEAFGSFEVIAEVKSLIVWPGLFILVPCIALTGFTGALIAKSRKGSIVQ